jgi:hypothetical protein
LVVTSQDGGGGPFVVFSTKRWSLDPSDPGEIDKFIKALKSVVADIDPWLNVKSDED